MKILKLNEKNPLETKVQTRDGRKARIICVDRVGPQPIVALILTCNAEHSETYNPNGKYTVFGNEESSSDLINAPETFERRGWVNVYPTAVKGVFENIYIANEAADFHRQQHGTTRIACVEVVVKGTVGEGVE